MPDAIVIGAGPNGLTGANFLADAGLDVLVLEAQDRPGGAVKSGELVEPGFTSDLFSAFYPLGVASPHFRRLGLEDHGLEWVDAPAVVAHPASDGTCATLYRDPERTAATLGPDRDAWLRLTEMWTQVQPGFISFLMEPFPPVRGTVSMLRRLGSARATLDFLRFAVMPLQRHVDEEFTEPLAGRLLAGSALHADITPESMGSALYGWVLCGIGQTLGWPVPRGGAQKITDALTGRLSGELRTSAEVTEILVSGRRVTGVRTADGTEHRAPIVLADVGAEALYERLLPPAHRIELDRFQRDGSTVKVDWTLDGPIPWQHEDARAAGTVHVTEGLDELTRHAAEMQRREMPSAPFLLLGQYAGYDPVRAPAGKEVAWAYTHVPQGVWDDEQTESFADLMEEQVERIAPGFRKLIRKRHVFTPTTLEQANQNLVGGAVNGGTAQVHQQLVFRPVPGTGRTETHVDGLYLASAAAHPGGGVHGACGANAARAALNPVARRLGARAVRMLR